MRNMFWVLLFGAGIGLFCTIIGAILTEKDKRKRDMDIEEALRADGFHWLYCSYCERWWFTNLLYCRKCTGELERPAQEVMVDFMIELTTFWQDLVAATSQRWPRTRYAENEVAGLLAVKKRHETKLPKR